MEIRNTRPYEAILIISAFIIYVVRRLFELKDHFNNLVQNGIESGIPRQEMLAKLTNYSHLWNEVFPLMASAVLLLVAWLVFQLEICPRVISNRRDHLSWLPLLLVILLVFSALFLFHSTFRYIRYSKTFWGSIIGLKTYSLYRLRTIFSDATGIAFLFVFFEMAGNLFRYMQQQLLKEKEQVFKQAASLLVLIPGGVVCILVFVIDLPAPLWSGSTQSELLWIASFVVFWAMHLYLLQHVIPFLKGPEQVLLQKIAIFLLICVAGNALVWAADSNFYFYYHPSAFYSRSFFLQLIRTLFPAIVFAVFRRFFSKEQVVLQQQVAGASAELAQLRSQINPHFLFNALNSLYAAALKEKAEKAADGIQRLGDMMRFMLQENNQERISIEKETAYLNNYIQLQRIRIDETQGIDIKVVLNQPDSEVYVAPMILIPFVENAFKHGISHRSHSWIFITLSFDATHLYFRVQNSRQFRTETDPEEYQSGIGLENVQKRLDLLYPGKHSLQIQESDHDYIAVLIITLT